jgi:hypothetical protein
MKLSTLALSTVLALATLSFGCASNAPDATEDASTDALTTSQLKPAQLKTRFERLSANTASATLAAKTLSGSWENAAGGSTLKFGDANGSGAFDIEYTMVLPDLEIAERATGPGTLASAYSPAFYAALQSLVARRGQDDVEPATNNSGVVVGFRFTMKGRAKIVQNGTGAFYQLVLEYLTPLIKPGAFGLALKDLLVSFDSTNTFDRKVVPCAEYASDLAGRTCIREGTEAVVLPGTGALVLRIATDIKGNTVKGNLSDEVSKAFPNWR